MAQTTEKPDLRILVATKNEGSFGDPYFKAIAYVVVINSEGKIRNPRFSQWSNDEPGGEYECFHVNAQRDPQSASLYGYKAIYKDVYEIDVARAESIAKTLKKVQRNLAKLDERFGTPNDYASYLIRVAQAIGCTDRNCFIRLVGRDSGSFDAGEYRYMDADAMRYHLDHEEREWAKVNYKPRAD